MRGEVKNIIIIEIIFFVVVGVLIGKYIFTPGKSNRKVNTFFQGVKAAWENAKKEVEEDKEKK